MALDADEFIRRFLLHTLPDGFHRIRHYGFLANGHRAAKLALCRELLAAPTDHRARDGRPAGAEANHHAFDRCPCCGGAMVTFAIVLRPPPDVPRSGRTPHEPPGILAAAPPVRHATHVPAGIVLPDSLPGSRQDRRGGARTPRSAHRQHRPPGITRLAHRRLLTVQSRPKAVSDHPPQQQSP